MVERGWWTVFRFRGSPVRLHWSLPFTWIVFSQFRFAPAMWLGMLLIVLWHEIGHAVLVRRYGFSVTRIDLSGLSGECSWSGEATAWQASVIAWGGVLAQALLLPVGFLLPAHLPWPFLAELVATFAWTNVWMIAFNLIPLPPLDGSKAWRLFSLWRASRQELQSYLSARATLRRRTRAAHDTGRMLRAVEKHDEIVPSQLELPDEVAAQLDRAVKRAMQEHKEKK